MASYDLVIVGGGHNGCICGAYMARAGWKVCIVERLGKVGGATNTEEVTLPGFKHDCGGTTHSVVMYNPVIRNDELGLLSKFGLVYKTPKANCAGVYLDGTGLVQHNNIDDCCQQVAQFSQKDAETYKKFVTFAKPLLDMMIPSLFASPAPVGNLYAQLDQSPEGQYMLRSFLKSAFNMCMDMFESEKARLLFTKMTTEPMVGPEDYGTGMTVFLAIPVNHYYPLGVPQGGSVQLANAAARCFEAHGGTIMFNAEVTKVNIKGGKAVGVTLASGEVIEAKKAVVMDMDPRCVFPSMISDVPADFQSQVDHIMNPPYSGYMNALALKDAPKWNPGPQISLAQHVEPLVWSEDFRRIFDEFKYGKMTASMCPVAITQSIVDPTRAPDGHHTMYLWQYAPYDLADGGPEKWYKIKETECYKPIEFLRKFSSNMGDDNIMGRCVHVPPDYPKMNPALVKASITGPGMYLFQMFSHRPIPELGTMQGPFQGLYWTGQCFHPAGCISGTGRCTVQKLATDFKMDFDKVIKMK